MIPRDTSVEAYRVQIGAFAAMTGEQKVAVAFELSEQVRDVTRRGIEARHPEYDEQHISWALFRALHGDEVFRAAWPEAPLVAL